MASVFKEAANQEIEEQPFYLRFKGSILIVLSGLVWILEKLATSDDIAELGWGGAIGIVATLIALLVNRFTKDGITPSMAERLEASGQIAFMDRISESGIAAYEPVTSPASRPAPPVEEPEVVAELADDTSSPADDSTPPELPTYYGDSTAD